MERSTNLVILDEVDRNLDSIGRTSLVKNLLPLLKNKVNTLIIISHNTDVSRSPNFNKVWTFEKKNNISKFKEN